MKRRTQSRDDALAQCLDVMVRMIPQACLDHGLASCWGHEHDAAIEAAALALYGTDRRRWPAGARRAAAGGYA
ncbi:hypothetical protein [Variovorax sp.]|uniref:hypothetical protein n=1 Tax=Variovorax sp. TaxID=1871043 RepID=UPI003BAC1388